MDELTRERQQIFARSWICAGRVSDVTQPGTWLRADVAGEDIVVMRGEDLQLRAFYNICLHRGTPLLDGETGRTTRIECPYHGWAYGCDGRLLRRFRLDELIGDDAPVQKGLAHAHVSEWQGFVFVRLELLSDKGEDLFTWMGEVPPWLETMHLRRARRVSYEVAAGWKLLVENFQESHHFPRVHPELEHITPTKQARSFFPKRSRWLGGEMDIRDEDETVSLSGRLDDRPLIVPKERARVVYDAMLFPLLLTSLQPDYFLTYRLEPLEPRRTRVIAETFVHPSLSRDAPLADVFDFWDRVNAQDRAICERQQRGVLSRAFTGYIHTDADEGVVAFQKLLGDSS